ncbi:MAG: hypothetical protein Q9M50_02510 [Methylococcales bacterium]|nr:hypothetical protein [Methylococcales bacterium]
MKQLVDDILYSTPKEFINKFIAFKNKYRAFISKKNDANKFKHKKIRSAIRLLETNKHLLFKYKCYPELNIPHTTNHIEGAFSHLKEKVNIHRGMNINRKKRAIIFLLMEEK